MKTKITLFPKSTLLILLLLATSSLFAQSGCEAEISAVKNRDNKKVVTRTYYKLEIVNKGNSSDTFDLSAKNVNASCSNIDGSNSNNNVVLDYKFLDSNKNSIEDISIGSGQTYEFLVSVEVPVGSSTEKWSCVEIIAKSKTCSDFSSSVVLQTYVLAPNQE